MFAQAIRRSTATIASRTARGSENWRRTLDAVATGAKPIVGNGIGRPASAVSRSVAISSSAVRLDQSGWQTKQPLIAATLVRA